MHPQNPRRPLRGTGRPGPRRSGQRRPVPAASSSSPAKSWIIIGFVVAALGGAAFVAKRFGSPAEEGPLSPSGYAASPGYVILEPPEESTKPRDDREDGDLESDDEYIDDAEGYTPEPVAFVEPPPAAPLEPLGAQAWDMKAGPAPINNAGPAPRRKAGAPGEENRLFTLVLSGRLGEQPLDPNDPQTWARLSYFLREEAPVRSYLVYPNGSIPVSMPAVPSASAKQRKPAADDPGPVGDPTAPTYRLVIQSTAQSQGSVTFYGKEIGSKYGCKILCRVEKRNGEQFNILEQAIVEEGVTPTKGAVIDSATLVRRLHDSAIDKLTKRLQAMRIFRTK